MKKLTVLLGAMLLFAVSASAAEFKGILVDQMCAKHHASEGLAYAKAHTRKCGLMPPCVQSGYGIFTPDGKYVTFDAAGNKKAEEALRKTDKKDDMQVKVIGRQHGDTIRVASLTIE